MSLEVGHVEISHKNRLDFPLRSRSNTVVGGQVVIKRQSSRLWELLSTLLYNGLRILDKTIDLKKLGQKIRFYRQGKGWSLGDLEEKAGVSKAYISDVENGVAGKPNIQYVYSIGVALGVTINDLLHDARPSQPRKQRNEDLPPGLLQLQQELGLTDDDVHMLAQVNFRGNRPRDMEGWRFLLDSIRMVTQRSSQK